MRFDARILAALLAAVVISSLAWQRPAAADSCADSLAAKRAGALYTLGDSAVALSFAREALRQAKQNCDGQTVAVVPLLTDLAALYQDLGRYSEAETILRRVIDIKLAAFAPEEAGKPGAALPNMIIDINNLAFVYGAQGKFKSAGKLFERVLEIAEQAVGDNHMLVSQALRNLAGNYRARGMHEKSGPLLARAAEIVESAEDEAAAKWAEKLDQPDENEPPIEAANWAETHKAPAEFLPSVDGASWAETLGLLSEEPL